MLETLLERPFSLNRHREAPLLSERVAFLKYLQERGANTELSYFAMNDSAGVRYSNTYILTS